MTEPPWKFIHVHVCSENAEKRGTRPPQRWLVLAGPKGIFCGPLRNNSVSVCHTSDDQLWWLNIMEVTVFVLWTVTPATRLTAWSCAAAVKQGSDIRLCHKTWVASSWITADCGWILKFLQFLGSDTVSCPSSDCLAPPPPRSQQPATHFLVENKKTKGHIQTSPNRFGSLSVRAQRACIGWRRASARLVRSLVGNSLFFLLSPRCVARSSEKKTLVH